MEFNEIKSFQEPCAKEIYHSYISSFPEDERRDEPQFVQLFTNPNVKILSVSENQENVGYLIIWLLSEFVFLEHFEVFETFRNRKLGGKILEKLCSQFPEIILESEPEHLNETASRRIGFYLRNGFSIVADDYIQPSYGKGKQPLNLFLLSNFEIISSSEIISEIHQTVYK